LQEFSKLAEVYLYVPGGLKGDEITDQFKELAHQYYESNKNIFVAAGEVDEDILQKILRDELDVLVDLDSLTVRGNAEIMYRKPAPICVSWLGFEPPFISKENYFLCDVFTHPAGVEEYYTEQLVRMPDVWVAVSGFKSTRLNGEAVRRALRVGLDQVVYLSVTPARKLNKEIIRAQIQIIKQVPESVLVQKGVGDSEVIRGLYQEVCEAEDVGFHRLKFVDMAKSEEEHRDIYKCADVVLDSYPYNGGTHNLEALWFNVPVVTLRGEGGMSRMGFSLLKNLGIDSGIASSVDEYVEWGVKFGKDESLRNSVKEKLMKSKQADCLAPVWNPQKFAGDLLAIFEELLKKN
jgi:predicted O-linked N-acetylglucosamine transferase (SPINDLY family)